MADNAPCMVGYPPKVTTVRSFRPGKLQNDTWFRAGQVLSWRLNLRYSTSSHQVMVTLALAPALGVFG